MHVIGLAIEFDHSNICLRTDSANVRFEIYQNGLGDHFSPISCY